MRDLTSLLNSLVNIDRRSLVAILASEAEAAQRSVNSARQRTASQRAKQRAALDHLARVERIPVLLPARRYFAGHVRARHRTLQIS